MANFDCVKNVTGGTKVIVLPFGLPLYLWVILLIGMNGADLQSITDNSGNNAQGPESVPSEQPDAQPGRKRQRKREHRVRRVAFTAYPGGDKTLDEYRTERDDTIRQCIGKGATYVGIGIETCPSTGRIHFQGYIEFATGRSMSAISKIIGFSPHLEVARGKPEQNVEYCKKDGDFKEEGQISVGQGCRTDLTIIRVRSLITYLDLINRWL